MHIRLPLRRAMWAAVIYPFIVAATFIIGVILGSNGDSDLPTAADVLFCIFTFPLLPIAEMLGLGSTNNFYAVIFILAAGSLFWGLITYGVYWTQEHLWLKRKAEPCVPANPL